MKQKFIKVDLDNISVYQFNFIVLLKSSHSEDVLPICIGPAEAHSIAAALHNKPFRRPLSHDLIHNMLKDMQCTVEKVMVVDMVDGTFFARIFLHTKDGEVLEMDSRPSDAFAVALRFHASIYVRADIFEENSVNLSDEEEGFSADSPVASEEETDPVSRLQIQLDEAVRDERYEEAARLRDQIKEMLQS